MSVAVEPKAPLSPGAERDKLARRLARDLGAAIRDFDLLADGDRVLVAISGGKDSYTMLHLLRRFAASAPIRVELIAVNIDQGHPGYPVERLRDWLVAERYDHRIVHEDTYSVVKAKIPEGKTYCSLCSRLRRGILYSLAQELGCTKIALGHHRDDALATLLLNLVFAGQLKSMPPKLLSDDGKNVVIRPLIFADEQHIARFAELEGFPILPCDLCGSQENLQRKQMQALLDAMETKNPGTKASMLAALRNVRPTHLLDGDLWKRLGLTHAPAEQAEERPPVPLERLTR
ncbi:MAG: tRNA 2-thiocytidine(32) synthetase TtcA [Polyangiales bacterium]